ncbi:MAG: hypothetical protein ABSA75_05735 [Candidatus Bathyarchaeia archaeon]|jgi:hypothetical protein
MMFEESEGMDSENGEVTAEADTQDNALMGSGEGYTLDADEAKKRITERRNKLIETKEIPNEQSSDGHKKEYSIDDEYSVKEGKRLKVGSDNSGTAKSPLQ